MRLALVLERLRHDRDGVAVDRLTSSGVMLRSGVPVASIAVKSDSSPTYASIFPSSNVFLIRPPLVPTTTVSMSSPTDPAASSCASTCAVSSSDARPTVLPASPGEVLDGAVPRHHDAGGVAVLRTERHLLGAALGVRDDELVDVGHGDVDVTVLDQGRARDLLARRHELGLDPLLVEEPELLGHDRRVEQQALRRRERVGDLHGVAAARPLVVAAAAGQHECRAGQHDRHPMTSVGSAQGGSSSIG